MIGNPVNVIHVRREGKNREICDTIDFDHALDPYHYEDRIFVEREGEERFLLTHDDFLEIFLSKKRKYEAKRERREGAKQNGNI